MKKVWITALRKDKDNAAKSVDLLTSTAIRYGLQADGHFWTDDLKNMAWMAAAAPLKAPDVSLWIVAGAAGDLSPEISYGLTLLYLSVLAGKKGLPVLWIDTGEDMAPEKLPSVFARSEIVTISNSTLGAKFAAKANIPAKAESGEFRLAVHANPGFGIWFETGPGSGHEWQGALLAVDKGEIKAHGVGPKGSIPEKTTLEYQMQGLELSMAETKLTGWAVRNHLSDALSYYVKVEGVPGCLAFGSLTEGEDAELHVLRVFS